MLVKQLQQVLPVRLLPDLNHAMPSYCNLVSPPKTSLALCGLGNFCVSKHFPMHAALVHESFICPLDVKYVVADVVSKYCILLPLAECGNHYKQRVQVGSCLYKPPQVALFWLV